MKKKKEEKKKAKTLKETLEKPEKLFEAAVKAETVKVKKKKKRDDS